MALFYQKNKLQLIFLKLKIDFSKIKIAENPLEDTRRFYIHFCSSPTSSIEKAIGVLLLPSVWESTPLLKLGWEWRCGFVNPCTKPKHQLSLPPPPTSSSFFSFLSFFLFSFSFSFLFFSHFLGLLKLTTSTEKKPKLESIYARSNTPTTKKTTLVPRIEPAN